jgi:hypothetical protein
MLTITKLIVYLEFILTVVLNCAREVYNSSGRIPRGNSSGRSGISNSKTLFQERTTLSIKLPNMKSTYRPQCSHASTYRCPSCPTYY